MNNERKESIYRAVFEKINEAGEPEFVERTPEEAAYAAVEWAENNPSEELITRVLGAIGYRENSWVKFVKDQFNKESHD